MKFSSQKMVVAGCIFVVVVAGILFWVITQYSNDKHTYHQVEEKYVIESQTVSDTDVDNEAAPDSLEWWQLVTVNLNDLSAEYPDVVAWIYFENEDISYPVVWSGDNKKYLRRDYTGERANSGSIFLDGESTPDFSDKHTIIYGHNMKDDSMFGKLDLYKTDESYYDGHEYFQIFIADKVTRYEIFAYEDISVEDEVFETYGNKTDSIIDMVQHLMAYSYRDIGITISDSDKLVTLSTCDGDDDSRFIVCGVKVDEHIQSK